MRRQDRKKRPGPASGGSPRETGGRGRRWNHRGPVLAAIFLASFIPGTLWFLRTQPAASGDYEDYINLASAMVRHGQFGYPEPTASRLPGYPAFLAALLSVSRSYHWISLWNVALTASIGLLVYGLAFGLTRGRVRVATAAGFLAALNPAFIFYAPIFASEHLFVPLVLGSFALLAWDRGRPVARAAGSGLLFGWAMLTRGEAMFYLPAALALVFLVRGTPRLRARMGTAMLAGCLAVTGPWWVRNAVVMDAPVGLSTYGGVNFYYAHNARQYGWHPLEETPLERLSEVARHQEGYRLGRAYLREDPSRLLRDIGRGTRALYAARDVEIVRSALFVPDYFARDGTAFRRKYPWGARGLVEKYWVGLVVLAAASAPWLRRQSRAAWLIPAAMIAGNWVCHAVVFWGKPRYRFTVEAFLCILAGVTLCELGRALHARRRRVPAQAGRVL